MLRISRPCNVISMNELYSPINSINNWTGEISIITLFIYHFNKSVYVICRNSKVSFFIHVISCLNFFKNTWNIYMYLIEKLSGSFRYGGCFKLMAFSTALLVLHRNRYYYVLRINYVYVKPHILKSRKKLCFMILHIIHSNFWYKYVKLCSFGTKIKTFNASANPRQILKVDRVTLPLIVGHGIAFWHYLVAQRLYKL